jgi:hypothetical protein
VFMLIELSENHVSGDASVRTHPSAAARTARAFRFYDWFSEKDGEGGLSQTFWLSIVLEDIGIAARVTGVLPMTLADLLAIAIQKAEQTPALLEHRSALKTLQHSNLIESPK